MDTGEDPLAFPHLGGLWEAACRVSKAAVPVFLQPAGCPGCLSRPRLSGRVTMGSNVLGRSCSVLRVSGSDAARGLRHLKFCQKSQFILLYIKILFHTTQKRELEKMSLCGSSL